MNFVEKGQPMTTPQGQAPEAIAGALFDFTGFLTTLPKERAVTLSGAHLATPVVDLLTEWAKTRGLNLDEANVKGWVAALTAVPADTNTTSGAADLPEALINIAREIEALKRDCGMDPESAIAIQNGRYMAISSKIRALAAGQATAAQAVVQDDLITIRKPTTSAEMLWLLKLAHLVISDMDKTLEETLAPAQPDCLTCNDHGAVGNILTAEPCPDCTRLNAQTADSVQEDAALWHWLAEYLVGTRTDLDDEIVACETVNDLRKLVESAIKQGEKQ